MNNQVSKFNPNVNKIEINFFFDSQDHQKVQDKSIHTLWSKSSKHGNTTFIETLDMLENDQFYNNRKTYNFFKYKS